MKSYSISCMVSVPPSAGSPRVRGSTLRRACYVVRFMFADRYAVRNSYYTRYGRFAVMATTEVRVVIPSLLSDIDWAPSGAATLGQTDTLYAVIPCYSLGGAIFRMPGSSCTHAVSHGINSSTSQQTLR